MNTELPFQDFISMHIQDSHKCKLALNVSTCTICLLVQLVAGIFRSGY